MRVLGGVGLLLLLMLARPLLGAHITDELLAGLYPEPATKGEPLALLPSGTPLEVIERQDGFVRVRVGDDQQGWVAATYVTDARPAKALLRDAQARIGDLERQLAERQPAACAESNGSGASRCPPDDAELAAIGQQLLDIAARLSRDPGSEQSGAAPLRNDASPLALLGSWLPALTGVLGVLAGALLARHLINRRVRERFGGIQF